ncbi:MAG: threonine synthase [Bacteroidetes bacterium]|nr:threonine synthase [Bacteroidota bacterium]
MLYYSTNKNSPKVDFREATIKGQAPDKGLYFPEHIPQLDKIFLKEFKSKSKAAIAFEVIKPYVGNCMADEDLYQICEHTVNFNFPLVKVTDSISSLELFHGPTLAFKDVGARFMSRCLGYFSKDNKREITVLVATSGDTGSAVANGFIGVEGVKVVILYPSGKVSEIQELQLTTLGKNITALEVQGTFDDCQQMVKHAFADVDVNGKIFLTSANSINVARWLPQQFYYFFALQQWQQHEPPVISVPSGNFGNICAGLIAALSGLTIKHFVAACNSNDAFVKYLADGNFSSQQAVTTISNAMDVGDPSNFVRVLELFNHDFEKVKNFITAYSVDDNETRKTMARVYGQYNYLLDPHGAVGFTSLEKYLNNNPEQRGLFLETAHPVKFENVVSKATGIVVDIPSTMQQLLQQKKSSVLINADYKELKEYLLK